MTHVKFIFDMPGPLNSRIERYAKIRGISKAAVVKIATSRFLEDEDSEVDPDDH